MLWLMYLLHWFFNNCVKFPQCDHVSSFLRCVTVRLTWTVCLPLQVKWRYSSSCVLLPLYRSSSCGAVWAHSRSGCSCWAGTGWRAGQFAARWQTSAVPTCRPYERLASSCGGHRRTLSHCRGLLGDNLWFLTFYNMDYTATLWFFVVPLAV